MFGSLIAIWSPEPAFGALGQELLSLREAEQLLQIFEIGKEVAGHRVKAARLQVLSLPTWGFCRRQLLTSSWPAGGSEVPRTAVFFSDPTPFPAHAFWGNLLEELGLWVFKAASPLLRTRGQSAVLTLS